MKRPPADREGILGAEADRCAAATPDYVPAAVRDAEIVPVGPEVQAGFDAHQVATALETLGSLLNDPRIGPPGLVARVEGVTSRVMIYGTGYGFASPDACRQYAYAFAVIAAHLDSLGRECGAAIGPADGSGGERS